MRENAGEFDYVIVGAGSAGIGVAQAIYSGFSVLVSFLWGAYYFGEPVAHLAGALGIGAAALLKKIYILDRGRAASASPLPRPPQRQPRLRREPRSHRWR